MATAAWHRVCLLTFFWHLAKYQKTEGWSSVVIAHGSMKQRLQLTWPVPHWRIRICDSKRHKVDTSQWQSSLSHQWGTAFNIQMSDDVWNYPGKHFQDMIWRSNHWLEADQNGTITVKLDTKVFFGLFLQPVFGIQDAVEQAANIGPLQTLSLWGSSGTPWREKVQAKHKTTSKKCVPLLSAGWPCEGQKLVGRNTPKSAPQRSTLRRFFLAIQWVYDRLLGDLVRHDMIYPKEFAASPPKTMPFVRNKHTIRLSAPSIQPSRPRKNIQAAGAKSCSTQYTKQQIYGVPVPWD